MENANEMVVREKSQKRLDEVRSLNKRAERLHDFIPYAPNTKVNNLKNLGYIMVITTTIILSIIGILKWLQI